MDEYKESYRRKLPHLHSVGSTLFVTFRLANSIPKDTLRRYRRERIQIETQLAQHVDDKGFDTRSDGWKEFHRQWFARFEAALHKESNGPLWLKEDPIASLVFSGFLYRDGKDFDLKALCLMSNHVHAVFRPRLGISDIVRSDAELKYLTNGPTLASIMRSLKGFTARQANKALGRSGQFWEAESYDHQIRDEAELYRIIRYVLQNPVKAGLVTDWRRWKWTYLADEYKEVF